jgi:hypothetical protein
MNPEEVEEAAEVAVAEVVTEAEAEAKSEETTSMPLLNQTPLKLKNESAATAPRKLIV